MNIASVKELSYLITHSADNRILDAIEFNLKEGHPARTGRQSRQAYRVASHGAEPSIYSTVILHKGGLYGF